MKIAKMTTLVYIHIHRKDHGTTTRINHQTGELSIKNSVRKSRVDKKKKKTVLMGTKEMSRSG